VRSSDSEGHSSEGDWPRLSKKGVPGSRNGPCIAEARRYTTRVLEPRSIGSLPVPGGTIALWVGESTYCYNGF
jgi:hypothetical protein